MWDAALHAQLAQPAAGAAADAAARQPPPEAPGRSGTAGGRERAASNPEQLPGLGAHLPARNRLRRLPQHAAAAGEAPPPAQGGSTAAAAAEEPGANGRAADLRRDGERRRAASSAIASAVVGLGRAVEQGATAADVIGVLRDGLRAFGVEDLEPPEPVCASHSTHPVLPHTLCVAMSGIPLLSSDCLAGPQSPL